MNLYPNLPHLLSDLGKNRYKICIHEQCYCVFVEFLEHYRSEDHAVLIGINKTTYTPVL
jgi:hypothetical protein